jgi:uncharacterized membrane protein YdjX (TVP38/TMEM64 family)
MEEVIQQSVKRRRKAMIKALLLVAFIVVAIYIIRSSPAKGFLTKEALGDLLESAGIWLP